MNRNRIHLVVDVLAYLAVAGLVATGIVLYYRLPPGSGNDAMLGLTRHQWGSVHFGLALGLLVLLICHVAFHWRWVTRTIGGLCGGAGRPAGGAGPWGAILLIALGLVLVVLAVAAWRLPVERRGGGGGGGEGERKRHRGGRASEVDSPATPAAADSGPIMEGPREQGVYHGRMLRK